MPSINLRNEPMEPQGNSLYLTAGLTQIFSLRTKPTQLKFVILA